MKKKIALMLTVLGVAAALVPAAGAKPIGAAGGGGAVCICPPPVTVQ
jgi:hypothetical protein